MAQAGRIDATLSAIAVASRRHRPQDPRLSGRDDWMVLNGAYLVDDERGAEFAAAAGSLSTPETGVELTGPWAPYSFTILESTEPDAPGAPREARDPGGSGTSGRPGEPDVRGP